MGLFDKIFGKKNKDDEQATTPNAEPAEEKNAEPAEVAADEKPEKTAEDTAKETTETVVTEEKTEESPKKPSDEAKPIIEMFTVAKDSVTPERRAEICTRFINNALQMGEELKSEDLRELNYAELCVLYNNFNWFLTNADPKIKEIAQVVIENNKKVVRTAIFTSLRQMTLYTLYARISNLPFSNNGALYIFTDKAEAEKQIEKSEIKYLVLREISTEQFNAAFCEFYCTGYTEVIIDMGTRVAITDVYTPGEAKEYGIINPSACSKMVFFNQMTAMYQEKAKAESREISAEENRNINKVWADITETLIRSTLLLPADKEEDKIKVKVPLTTFTNGTKWIAVFTDQGAVNLFHKKLQTSATVKDLILTQFKTIKDDPNVTGIIVNPARESFRIPKEVLATRQVKTPEEKTGEQPENKNEENA